MSEAYYVSSSIRMTPENIKKKTMFIGWTWNSNSSQGEAPPCSTLLINFWNTPATCSLHKRDCNESVVKIQRLTNSFFVPTFSFRICSKSCNLISYFCPLLTCFRSTWDIYSSCYTLNSNRTVCVCVYVYVYIYIYIYFLNTLYIYICIYTGCFKKSFTTLKAFINLFGGNTQCFELSQRSKTHWHTEFYMG
jgi:hypothetical protein